MHAGGRVGWIVPFHFFFFFFFFEKQSSCLYTQNPSLGESLNPFSLSGEGAVASEGYGSFEVVEDVEVFAYEAFEDGRGL